MLKEQLRRVGGIGDGVGIGFWPTLHTSDKFDLAKAMKRRMKRHALLSRYCRVDITAISDWPLHELDDLMDEVAELVKAENAPSETAVDS
jgi:hypothetical protein